jgi:prepilin-type N-terminal cleavage/methylation domain-containing protein
MSVTPRLTGSQRRAFTLVELLVVIAIIGVLVGLTIPAIQFARESARKTTCKNNLKQIYLATQQFLGQYQKFPSGGWGSGWVGDPDRPVGTKQPGGFFYSILPYMERQGLYDTSKRETDPARKGALQLEMIQEWIPTYTCPSRRSPAAYMVPPPGPPAFANADMPTNLDEAWYRSDYSVNGGTVQMLWDFGPANYAAAQAYFNSPQFRTDMTAYKNTNGIAHQFSEITIQDIFDGASHTYLVGEKYLNSAHYESGQDSRDDHPAYGGDVRDLFSFGDASPLNDQFDIASTASPLIFGSAHDGVFHVVKCDGSVEETFYDIALSVHAQLSNRRDSRP